MSIHIKSARSHRQRDWSIQQSAELYGVKQWGGGFFSINDRGNVQVHPWAQPGPSLDLEELAEELEARGYELPILVRFSDILKQRVQQLRDTFGKVIEDLEYQNEFVGVYPIKVNQQRHIVEEIVSYGGPSNFGLEVGSKPELLGVLAVLDSPDTLVVCNGYKDEEYLDMVILATKMGMQVIPVIEKFSELHTVVRLCKKHGVRQPIGVRAKLATRGAGRWEASGGDRSKFGLSVSELLRVRTLLEQEGMLDMLKLLHYHIGSQVTNIRAIRSAVQEAARIYVELVQLGCPITHLDVGGGLAVDYDGSKTNFRSSMNYSLQEYATGVVSTIKEACDDEKVPHPVIVTESGRALTAHHAVLIVNVLGVTEFGNEPIPDPLPQEEDPAPLEALVRVHQDLTRKNVQESYNEALDIRDEALSLFNLGYLTLEGRAAAESIFWAICRRILSLVREMAYVPEDLQGLEKMLADTYICNFSVFQSVPDFWAVQQLFPIMPIHRLDERPTRKGILGDVTCDSDGKIDQFIDLRDVKEVLDLHPLDDRPYHLGIFLVGAYQETLSVLHNLFGDTNAVHVAIEPEGGYRIEHVVKGDTVTDVLRYVSFPLDRLISRMRRRVESAIRQGQINFQEGAHFLRRYESGLAGYTYMI